LSSRVDVTPEAADMLRRLRAANGPLMFHQSGGCCDGSSPMCYPDGDFITGGGDVFLGTIPIAETDDAEAGSGSAVEADAEPVGLGSLEGPDPDAPRDPDRVPVWMSKGQFAYWKHTHLTIDVVPGRGAGFSLEAPYGVRFLIRSRLLTEDELIAFGELPAPTS
jgi:uncharacterized protein (DUF779 family)